jgi:hypothetical protein
MREKFGSDVVCLATTLRLDVDEDLGVDGFRVRKPDGFVGV